MSASPILRGRRSAAGWLVLLLFSLPTRPAAAEKGSGDLWDRGSYLVLCWHDVPSAVRDDPYAVSMEHFRAQLRVLADAGCSFVGVDAILGAARGGAPFPKNAVLLTFDDAYLSFYRNVYPVLKDGGYPAVLSVVSSWLETPPARAEVPQDLMSWAQVREVAADGLVEIASHSHDSHRALPSGPYGSTSPAFIARAYEASSRSYESEAAYRARVRADLEASSRTILARAGKRPRVLAWPYGRYTAAGIAEARAAGFELALTLDAGLADAASPLEAPRRMVSEDPPADVFARGLASLFASTRPIRALQADLDLVYDPDPAAMERNIDAFVERVHRLAPTDVYLQAFCDDDGDGVVESVYFPNRVLPLKADIFSRASRALGTRGIRVHAWMPTLGIRLGDAAENERLRVKERRGGRTRNAEAWYSNRLSPFSEEAAAKLEALYEDLASNSVVDGIVFQDDGYLGDFEDYSVHALPFYASVAGSPDIDFADLPAAAKRAWTTLKTDRIVELTERLKDRVRYWNPKAAFSRTVYANVLLNPPSEEWFAQDYAKFLRHYDYVVVMAYPDMEGAAKDAAWLSALVARAASHPEGLERTVFKTQAYDWARKRWVASDRFAARMEALVSAGARHLAYYPDDYTVGKPDAAATRNYLPGHRSRRQAR